MYYWFIDNELYGPYNSVIECQMDILSVDSKWNKDKEFLIGKVIERLDYDKLVSVIKQLVETIANRFSETGGVVFTESFDRDLNKLLKEKADICDIKVQIIGKYNPETGEYKEEKIC